MSVRLILPLAVTLFVGLAARVPAADPPIYRDPSRGVRLQRDAADEAEEVVLGGKANAKAVLDLLADPSAWVRDRVVNEVVKRWSEDDVLALAPGLVDKRPLVIEGVAEILGRKRGEKFGELLGGALARAPREETAAVILWAITELADPELAKPVGRFYEKQRRSALLKVTALDTLAKLDPESGRVAALEAIEDDLAAVRAAALTWIPREDAFRAIADWLKDPPRDRGGSRDRLYQAAAHFVEESTGRAEYAGLLAEIIDAAIDRMSEMDGRTLWDWVGALRSLSGEKHLYEDVDSWRTWWRKHRDDWKPAGTGTTGEASASDAKGPRTYVAFHGIRVDSERLAFLHDLSGGMSRTMEGEWKDAAGKTRLDYAKEELARVLRAVADESWINVIFFASEIIAFGDRPQPVKRARGKILSWVEKQEIPSQPHMNRGNLYDSLVHVTQQPLVDTIYLFTEGAPTEGKYLDYERILAHYAQLHRVHPVRVHVLVLGKPTGRNKSFLERLAQLCDGNYREIVAESEQ